ncbi:hypothetical protein DL96DRAFT_1595579 [Flagelloscypha sp. PMI_526]|nr:hypothetical protein DL96DRAFT_1595579 [Flagelloscypha sp. PMI_526]
MSKSNCSLLCLPPDILLHVFGLSKPLEVLRLRQTCSLLRDLSYECVLWVHLLRLFIHKARFHPASFLIDSMTSAELEAAATVTLRFLRNFAHDEPESRAKIHCIKGNDKIHSLDLVAGDRYLVAISGSRIVLWDLGVIGCKGSESEIPKQGNKRGKKDPERVPRLIASTHCDIPKRQKPWVHTEFSGEDILVRVASAHWPGTWTVLYKINLSQPLPKFERFATLKTEFWSNSYHFNAERMLIVFSTFVPENQNVWIWDLNTKMLISWPGEPGIIENILLTGDFIVLFIEPDSEEIAFKGQVFALPKPPASLSESPAQEVHTGKEFSNPDDLTLFRTSDSWEPSVGASFSFDVIAYFAGTEDYECTIIRKVFRPRDDDPSVLEAITQHQAVYSRDMHIPPTVGFTACDLLHNDLRMIHWLETPLDEYDSTTPTQIVCHLSSVAGDPAHDICGAVYIHDQASREFEYVFSPRTGRLCFISGTWGTDITFYDYGVL